MTINTTLHPTAGDNPWSEERIQSAIQLWKLNAEDATRLRQLGQRLKDIESPWNNPAVVLGYMTSPQGKNTEQLFRKMIQWRAANNIDNLLTTYTPNPLLLDYTPIAFLQGHDHDGDPIYVERGGAIDALGMLKKFPRAELDKYAIWLRELQSNGEWVEDFEKRYRNGSQISKITVVYDLKGLSSRHLNHKVLSWFKQYMELTGQYYPAPVKRMVIIRAPAAFRGIWKAVKHCFSAECREKMVFSGAKDHLEVLSKYMDLDVLPAAIYPNGKGTTAIGMPPCLDGGKLPDNVGPEGRDYVRSGSSLTAKEHASETSSSTASGAEEEDNQHKSEKNKLQKGVNKKMHLKFLRSS